MAHPQRAGGRRDADLRPRPQVAVVANSRFTSASVEGTYERPRARSAAMCSPILAVHLTRPWRHGSEQPQPHHPGVPDLPARTLREACSIASRDGSPRRARTKRYGRPVLDSPDAAGSPSAPVHLVGTRDETSDADIRVRARSRSVHSRRARARLPPRSVRPASSRFTQRAAARLPPSGSALAARHFPYLASWVQARRPP